MKLTAIIFSLLSICLYSEEKPDNRKYNVMLIISDDLSSRALACYGNSRCKTPNIDKLASAGTLFTNTYCQFPVCGASRASFMSGLYPHQNGIYGNRGPERIGKILENKYSMSQNFKEQGYVSARIGKIYHMRVPGDITANVSGPDHKASWTEAYNCPGNEWHSKGEAAALCKTRLKMDDKSKHYGLGFGWAFWQVKTPGPETQPDYKAASKAIELLDKYEDKPFFMAIGLVRPHVPLVAPKKYFDMYPPGNIDVAEMIDGDIDDIPKAGRSKTSSTFGIESKEKQQAILSAYYASVSFMDAQVGRIVDTLEKKGLREKTIIVFTSDHGWHLGEHTFWQKVNLHEESAQVPLIISVPGSKKAVSGAITELIDLYPTLSSLCKINTPKYISGNDLTPILKEPEAEVRDGALCVTGKESILYRTKKWAFMMYGKDGKKGMELYDMQKDPKQYNNLAGKVEYKEIIDALKKKLTAKLNK